MNVPDYDRAAKLVRDVMVLRQAHGGRHPRIDATIDAAQLGQLQAIEAKLASALEACGTPPEQAAHSAFEFVRQCTQHYSRRSPTSA